MKKIASLFCVIAIFAITCIPAFAVAEERATVYIPQQEQDGYGFYFDGKFEYIPVDAVLGPTGYGTSSGAYVKTAQKALNVIHTRFAKYNPSLNCHVGTPDGLYGQKTYAGAMNFQVWTNTLIYDEKIQTDGIIGPKTLPRLSYYCNFFELGSVTKEHQA